MKKHNETLENLISSLADSLPSPPDDSPHLKDWQLIWYEEAEVEQPAFFLTKNKHCRMVMTGDLTNTASAQRLVTIVQKPFRAAQNWELVLSGISFCPSYCYFRFASAGIGTDDLFTGIVRIGGKAYEDSFLNMGERLMGLRMEDIELYAELCQR